MAQVRPTMFKHFQTTPATTWTINHNLSGNGGEGIPIVEVIVDHDGAKTKMIPLSVTKTSKDTVTIEFSVAQTGLAMVIV
jgi:hypothetical protein